MALDTITVYCDGDDVRRLYSTLGVNLRLDDDANGTVSAGEEEALTDCLIEAAEEINLYCGQRYSVAALVRSNWINRKATWLAAYYLSKRRANPAPEAMEDEYDKTTAVLERILENGMRVPGLPAKRTGAPTWSNTRCVPGYEFRVIRIEKRTSSQATTAKPQVTDYREQATIEL